LPTSFCSDDVPIDAENWRDLKTQKKIKIHFEGASWLKGTELGDAENWRDLKTQKKI
jgi:hypothetical protein